MLLALITGHRQHVFVAITAGPLWKGRGGTGATACVACFMEKINMDACQVLNLLLETFLIFYYFIILDQLFKPCEKPTRTYTAFHTTVS